MNKYIASFALIFLLIITDTGQAQNSLRWRSVPTIPSAGNLRYEDMSFINASIRVLEKSNTILNPIDFDDMVYLPLVFKLRLFPQDWVLIDEAQDTNPTRRALAARMLKPGGRVIAVGDPRQAIYGFTGADNDALEQIAEKFNCARMPAALSRVDTMYTDFLNMSAPGFSSYIPVTAGIFSSFCTASVIVPAATP